MIRYYKTIGHELAEFTFLSNLFFDNIIIVVQLTNLHLGNLPDFLYK